MIKELERIVNELRAQISDEICRNKKPDYKNLIYACDKYVRFIIKKYKKIEMEKKEQS